MATSLNSESAPATTAAARQVDAECQHHRFIVHHASAGLSDVETAYGHCPDCNRWMCATTWLGSSDPRTAMEFRDLNEREMDARLAHRARALADLLRYLEDRYRYADAG